MKVVTQCYNKDQNLSKNAEITEDTKLNETLPEYVI